MILNELQASSNPPSGIRASPSLAEEFNFDWRQFGNEDCFLWGLRTSRLSSAVYWVSQFPTSISRLRPGVKTNRERLWKSKNGRWPLTILMTSLTESWGNRTKHQNYKSCSYHGHSLRKCFPCGGIQVQLRIDLTEIHQIKLKGAKSHETFKVPQKFGGRFNSRSTYNFWILGLH